MKSVKIILGGKQAMLRLFGLNDMMLEMWALERKARLFSKVFSMKVKTVVG